VPRALVVSIVLLAGCPSRDAAPQPAPKGRGVTDPKATIDQAKDGAQRANEAAEQRNDEAFDRAMQGEAPAQRGLAR
jgi:hypothetical protein